MHTPPSPTPPYPPEPIDLSEESVAGEEDPGASLDMPPSPAKADAGADQPPP